MNIFRSVSNNIPPIHPKGHLFIGIFFLVSVILGFLWFPLFWIGLILTVWCICFFRDPERVTPQDKDFVISPADGKISWVGLAMPPEELNLGEEEMQKISVFMNVFNVHVNRSPMEGVVKEIIYRPGKFLNAELDKASEENERNGLVLETSHGKIGVVQIAGLIAKRIVHWTYDSAELEAGERFGLIRFGSRVDLYLPKDVKTRVSLGQKVIAGETILASFKAEEESIEDYKIS